MKILAFAGLSFLLSRNIKKKKRKGGSAGHLLLGTKFQRCALAE